MGDNLCGEFKIKAVLSQKWSISNIDKNSKFYFVKWETKKHSVLCEIKAGDKLTFVTGLCSRLVKSKGIYNLEEWCPQGKKRRGGCCALCGFPSHAL